MESRRKKRFQRLKNRALRPERGARMLAPGIQVRGGTGGAPQLDRSTFLSHSRGAGAALRRWVRGFSWMNEVLRTEQDAAAHSGTIVDQGDGGARCRIVIRSRADILEARKSGRELARALGFSTLDCILIVAAISELARNIMIYAQQGEIWIRPEILTGESGIEITAEDCGPGIRDVRSAINDGISATDSLGLGLPGVKRIMDDFEIVSKPGRGATVTVRKWSSRRRQLRGFTHHPRATGGEVLPGESLDV